MVIRDSFCIEFIGKEFHIVRVSLLALFFTFFVGFLFPLFFYVIFGVVRKMELYYKNEILFVQIHDNLDEQYVSFLKRKVFRILNDYGIGHVVFEVLGRKKENIQKLKVLEKEYYERFNGSLLIR